MPSIRREIPFAVSAETVWAAVRDVGNVHRVLAPGFVADCHMDGDARVVTFGNGMVAREVIVDVDDATRRFAYAAIGGRLTHHNAAMQIVAEDAQSCRMIWIADLMPAGLAPVIAGMMEESARAMKRRLEGSV